MSFAAAFYNFTLELNHVDRQIFARFRTKTALHPNESLQHLYARMIAYAHCYRPGQCFSQGLFEPKEPTIWAKEVTGEILLWVQLGVPERRKLEVTLRSDPSAEHIVYFYEPQQIPEFCHMLRGSKTNWVKDIQFFRISEDLLESLAPIDHSSPTWNVTFVDNHVYLTCDGMELEGDITPIQIWEEYQTSLDSTAPETLR
jgi:uncharacterized protein YaeQ